MDSDEQPAENMLAAALDGQQLSRLNRPSLLGHLPLCGQSPHLYAQRPTARARCVLARDVAVSPERSFIKTISVAANGSAGGTGV